MLAITDELFPPLLSRAYNSHLRNTKQGKYWNSRHHPWLNFLKKEKKILEMVSTHLEGNSAWRPVTRSVLSSLIQPGNCEGWPNIRDVPVVQKPAARSIPTPFRPHLARISFTNHFSSGGRGRPLSFSTQSHSRIDTRCGFSWTVLENRFCTQRDVPSISLPGSRLAPPPSPSPRFTTEGLSFSSTRLRTSRSSEICKANNDIGADSLRPEREREWFVLARAVNSRWWLDISNVNTGLGARITRRTFCPRSFSPRQGDEQGSWKTFNVD